MSRPAAGRLSHRRRRPSLHLVGHGGDGVRSREPLLARRPRGRRLGGRVRRALAQPRDRLRCGRPGRGVRVGRDTASGGSEGEARRGRRREGRVPDALGDVHRRRRRCPGAGRSGEAVGGARRRRRRLQPRRRPARDRRLGARRRRLGLAEGADDTAGDRARLGVGGGSRRPRLSRRASTSTGSGRAPARPSWTAPSRRPSPSSAGSTLRSGCCWTRGSRPRSTATSGSAVPAARVPRRWVSSSSRPTRTAPLSSPPSSRPEGIDAGELRLALRDRYGVTVAGGHGDLKNRLFRIGHIGYYDVFDIVAALGGRRARSRGGRRGDGARRRRGPRPRGVRRARRACERRESSSGSRSPRRGSSSCASTSTWTSTATRISPRRSATTTRSSSARRRS